MPKLVRHDITIYQELIPKIYNAGKAGAMAAKILYNLNINHLRSFLHYGT
jgi:hypothetical protein